MENVCYAVRRNKGGRRAFAIPASYHTLASEQTAIAAKTGVRRLQMANGSRHNGEPSAVAIRVPRRQKSLPPASPHSVGLLRLGFLAMGCKEKIT